MQFKTQRLTVRAIETADFSGLSAFQLQLRVDAPVFFARPSVDPNFWNNPGRELGELERRTVDLTVTVVPITKTGSLAKGEAKLLKCAAGNPFSPPC